MLIVGRMTFYADIAILEMYLPKQFKFYQFDSALG